MKLKYLLPLIAFVCSSVINAQTQKDTISIQVPEMWSGEPADFIYNYTIDSAGYRIPQGAFALIGKKNSSEEQEYYTVKGAHDKGKIHGIITCEYSYKRPKNQITGFRNLNYRGNFKNGLPDGNFHIKSFGHKSSAYDVNINFKDGVLCEEFSFNAFIKKELSIVGKFAESGVMDGEWSIRVHNTLTDDIKRFTVTLLEGIAVDGPNYNKELSEKAKLYAAGKISKEELKKEGILVHTSRNKEFEEAVKGAVNSRFIPFDRIGKIDVSKINLNYKYLDYQAEIKGEGFKKVLAEMDNYKGLVKPEMASFGIHYSDTTKLGIKRFDSSYEPYILHAKWETDGLATVYFTPEQSIALEKKLKDVQTKWANNEIILCKFRYESFIAENLVNKSTEEVTSLLNCDTKKLADYTPIIGFHSKNFTAKENNGTEYILDCSIDVAQRDSVGYKTYDWAISIDGSEWEEMHQTLNKNLSKDRLKRIRNEYDDVNELIKNLDIKSAQIYKDVKNANPYLRAESVRSYAILMRESTTVKDEDWADAIQRINSAIQVQKHFEAWVTKTLTIKKNEQLIRASRRIDRNILKDHYSRLEATNFTWAPESDIKRLDSLIEYQNICLDFSSKSEQIRKNNSLIKKRSEPFKNIIREYSRYSREHKTKWTSEGNSTALDSVLDIQNRTLQFIDKREIIASNTAHIVESCGKCKDVKKKYPSYAESLDVSWSPEVDQDKLDRIIDMQEWTLDYIRTQEIIRQNHKKLKALRRIDKGAYKEYLSYMKNLNLVWTPENRQQDLDEVVNKQESYKRLLNKN